MGPLVSVSHLQISLRLEVQRPSQTAAEQGEAEVRILNFKTTWSEFQKPSQTAATRGEAELRIYNLKKYHFPRVGPKQLCASAHLGCTRAAGTHCGWLCIKIRLLEIGTSFSVSDLIIIIATRD